MEDLNGINVILVILVQALFRGAVLATIGFLPPVLIRFGLLKRRMTRWAAIGTSAFFLAPNVVVFTLLGVPMGSFLFAFLSYVILRSGHPVSRELSAAIVGQNGLTELMYAAAVGNIDRVSDLLLAGSPANQQDDQGKTALMYGAMNNHSEVIRLLLQNGANPDITTSVDRTAAWFAERQRFGEVLRLLGEYSSVHRREERHALVREKSSNGITPV